MALRRVGTQLVAEGATSYISLMQKAATATRELGPAATEGARGLDGLNAKSAITAVTIGNVLATAIQKATGFLVGQTQAAVGTVIAHERMVMSLSSLVAREFKAADATLSMSDALEKATPRAEELLKWIQQLAIKSPFDQEGVAQAFKTAQVYGFTSTQAQKLTQTLIDFAAATGKSSAVIQQLAFPLGQIKNTGKALTLDLRQLTNAGVDVTSILKSMGQGWEDVSAGAVKSDEFIMAFVETLDKDFGGAAARSTNTLGGLLNSLEDIQDMATRALFTPIFQAITPHIATMADSLQRLIPYLELVGQSLGRFTVFLIENRAAVISAVAVMASMVAGFLAVTHGGFVLTAALKGVSLVLGPLISGIMFLTSPLGIAAAAVAALAGAFALIGVGIRKAQQEQQNRMAQMTAAVQSQTMVQQSIVEATEQRRLETMGEFGDKIMQQQAQQGRQTSEQARSWGENIIIQFAQGMANAITAVIQVLIQVGNVIASWLAPGSPPKILPDITKWGVSAMNEYIKGFSAADFSLFNDVAKTIEGYLRSLDLPEKDVVPAIMTARSAVAGLVDQFKRTGQIGAAAFEEMFAALRITDPALRAYTKALFDVQMAQEKLNQVTAKYDELLNPLKGELAGIQKKRQAFIDKQRKMELKDIIKRASAEGNAEAVMLAQMELREIELKNQIGTIEERRDTEVAAAQAEVDAAQETLNAQKALVDVQLENNRLIQEQIRLLERLADTVAKAAGAGGAGKMPKIPAGAGGAGVPTLGDALSGLGAGLGAGLGSGMDAAIEGLKDRLTSLVDEIKAPFAGIGAQITQLGLAWAPVWTAMQEKVATMWAVVKPIVDELDIDLGDVARAARSVAAGFIAVRTAMGISSVITSVGGAFGILKGAITGIGSLLLGLAGVLSAPVVIALAAVAIGVGLLIHHFGGIEPAIEGVKGWITSAFGPGGTAETMFNTVVSYVTSTLLPGFNRVVDFFRGPFNAATTLLSDVWTGYLQPALTAVTDYAKDHLFPFFKSVANFFRTAFSLSVRVLTGIFQNLFLPALQGQWEMLNDKILPVLKQVWEWIKDKVGPIVKSFADNELAKLRAALVLVGQALDAVRQFLDDVSAAINSMSLPGWMEPGSPPPLYHALMDIGNAMQRLHGMELPKLRAGLDIPPPRAAQSLASAANPVSPPATPGQITNNSTVNNYNSFQGIGSVSAGNGMDVAVIEAIVERTMRRQFA